MLETNAPLLYAWIGAILFTVKSGCKIAFADKLDGVCDVESA